MTPAASAAWRPSCISAPSRSSAVRRIFTGAWLPLRSWPGAQPMPRRCSRKHGGRLLLAAGLLCPSAVREEDGSSDLPDAVRLQIVEVVACSAELVGAR